MSYLALGLNTAPVRRAIGCGALEQLADLVPILLAAGIMGIGVAGLRVAIEPGPLLELIVVTAAGGAVYLAAGTLLKVRSIHEVLTASNWRRILSRQAGR